MSLNEAYISRQSQELSAALITIRRHLHSHPECSFQEFETAKFVAQKLKEFGIVTQKTIANTGIIALIEGRNSQKRCLALRADMDALPIEEQNNTAYRSQNKGVMHACGHDVHTTCLLGAAKILQQHREDFEGTIKLIFQPGEEKSPGGASIMIEEGALENPKPEAIFGLHVDPSLPAGKVGFKSGSYMASADEIHIRITGKGGHAALPHQTIDPIAISALVITALQQIVSRKANPLIPTVLSFGKISGGTATNIIPDEVEISGTFRTFDEQWRQQAKELIRETVTNIATAYGGKATIDFPPGYPSVYNNPELSQFAVETAENYLGKENVVALDLRMTAEDFAHYAQKIKGCFFRLGTNKNNKKYTHPVHNAHFDIDESAITTGVSMITTLAYRYLTK